MSNFSIAGGKYEVEPGTIYAPVTTEPAMKSWPVEIVVVVVGLVALAFFVALGGMFALLGPWVIYMGVLSIRKPAGRARYLLRMITGAALFFLSVPILLMPHAIEPWCVVGGVTGLLAGWGYLIMTLFALRKTGKTMA